MRCLSLLSSFVLYSVCVLATAVPRATNSSIQAAAACNQLRSQLSGASAVFFPGSTGYTQAIAHVSLQEVDQSVCSIEPGNAEDLGKLLQVVGKARVPFGVKGGGHATNVGFSSSPGIQIAMSRFGGTTYHPNNGTVDVGAGQIWDDVYGVLDPLNITVPGGRITTVGVGGYTLGGGLNYWTNQHGLTVDQIVRFQVVLPSGQVATASAQTNPDLFFGLKGGYNNFGIVTQITYNAINIEDGLVWGGFYTVSGDNLEAVTNATVKFSEEVTDPKAQIVTFYESSPSQLIISVSMFYDAPTPPSGIFDDFLAIPPVHSDIGTRPIVSLVKATQSNATAGPATRGFGDTAPISKPTVPIINAIINETLSRTQQLANTSLASLTYAVEIFRPDILSHAQPGSSAYPPTRAVTVSPLAITYAYTSAADDQLMNSVMTESSQAITRFVGEQGQDVNQIPIYGNYASSNTWTAQRIFGASLPRLQIIKKKYDPSNVMGLTGGWKVTA